MPCRKCGEQHRDCEKRARSCGPCAIKALEAERAKPPAPKHVGPEPTDAQVAAFVDAFYGDLTQWGHSKRQRNGIADGVRQGLRAALAIGLSGNPAGAEELLALRSRDTDLSIVGRVE